MFASGAAKRGRKGGNGRNGFDDYPDAPTNKIKVPDQTSGDRCPCCFLGRLYSGESRKLIGFTGSPPIEVERQEKEVLRCNACGKEYMSHEKSLDKWDKRARSSVVLQSTKQNALHYVIT